MRAAWLERRRDSLAQRIALGPLVPLSWLYGTGALLARSAWEHEVRPRRRLPAHVVSVGNLLVGGSGKTPFAGWLAQGLQRRGRKVVLASRGHGRRGREPVTVVSDGRFVHGSAESSGDEPIWLAAHAAGVPVLVGRDRGLVGLRALSGFGADVLVLDDGFQHHRLARDVDLVCFDGGFGLGNGHLLPRGPLREPLRVLSRAHAFAVVDGPLAPEDAARIRAAAPAAVHFALRRRPRSLRSLAGGPALSPEALRGAQVGLITGVARPQSVRHTLESLGARVVALRSFPDHHRYTPRDLEGLAAQTPFWVTTEMDAVKLVPGWAGRADLRVLAQDLEVEEGDALLDWLEARLR